MDKAPLSGQQFLTPRMVFPWLRDSAGSIGSSSRAQSWRFWEKFALPLSGRLLHDSVHQNSTVMIRKKNNMYKQQVGGMISFDIIWLRFPNCLSAIFSVGSSQHCCSSAVISRRQFGCLIGINLRALHVHGQCNDLALLWVKISRGPWMEVWLLGWSSGWYLGSGSESWMTLVGHMT